MLGIVANIFKPLQLMRQVVTRTNYEGLHTASNSLVKPLLTPQTIDFTAIRTKIRCYFPRPNEVRRIRRHGWEKRMSTPAGRRTIMRRILKGRFVLSH